MWRDGDAERIHGAHWRHTDYRRYFPEWAERSQEIGPEVEADRNSYLANGYAEEFGYHAQPGYSRGVWVLDEESPERCEQWYGQSRATHPGYPEMPTPIVLQHEDDRESLPRPASPGRTLVDAARPLHVRDPAGEGVPQRGGIIVVSARAGAKAVDLERVAHRTLFRWVDRGYSFYLSVASLRARFQARR